MAEISRYHGVCFRATLTELLEYTLHDVDNRNSKSDGPPSATRAESHWDSVLVVDGPVDLGLHLHLRGLPIDMLTAS